MRTAKTKATATTTAKATATTLSSKSRSTVRSLLPLLDEFNRMQQKFRKLEQLMQTKRRLSQSFNLRLAQIEQKLSASMERSQQQKELSLMRRVR